MSFSLMAVPASVLGGSWRMWMSLSLTGTNAKSSGSSVLSTIHMLWSTAVARIMRQQRLGLNCMVPPEKSRQRNLCLSTPKHLSMTFLVLVWLFWYLSSPGVKSLFGRNGVSIYGVRAYPLSPSSHPSIPPPDSVALFSN